MVKQFKNKQKMKKKNLLLTAIAIFGLATITNAQVPSYVPTNGLVGYWPFNGNANDASTNNLGGNVLGGPTLTTDRNGNSNASYDFDYSTVSFGGQTDEVYIPYNSILNSTNISVSVWVYPRSYYWSGNPGPSAIIRRFEYGYSNPNGQTWGIDFNQSTLYAFILEGASNNSQNNATVTHNTPLSLNTWHHIVFTYNGASLNLYLDGALVNSVSSTLPLNTAGNSGISIGESNQANGYWLPTDGKIDDIAIWNRALTSCEIVALYNGQNPTQPTTACYETATFNNATCQWDVTGTQPAQPTIECFETATFNTTTCQWDVTGTQPSQPTTACYETATFNTGTCSWDVTGTQPAQPTIECFETATFNTTTCQWDVTGTQPSQPTIACYETASFNTTTCQWDVTGTQPSQPTLACYESATFNTTTCQWDVTGSPASISQPANQTININNIAQFIVSSSDPGATYQWQTDLGVGFQNLSNAGQYSGVTTGTLTVSSVTMSNDNQNFRCIVSSGSCSDTSNVAVLTVNNNVGINETSQDKLFSVFPNPAQSIINVKADSKLIGSVYSIYDYTGRVVLTGKLNSENTTIELGNLSGGIYMFSVGENMKQTFKMIKE